MNGLLFIRHAETDMAGTFCGHSDPPINSRGRAQIAGLTASLHNEVFDAVYSSDLQRAVQTAHALAEQYAAPVTTTASLREIYFGEWEGLTWAEIERRDAAGARRWTEAFPTLPAPGGESYASFERRILDEVESLRRLAEHEHIAVVTHGGVMRVVLCRIAGYSEKHSWELTKSYCSTFACATGVTSAMVSR